MMWSHDQVGVSHGVVTYQVGVSHDVVTWSHDKMTPDPSLVHRVSLGTNEKLKE